MRSRVRIGTKCEQGVFLLVYTYNACILIFPFAFLCLVVGCDCVYYGDGCTMRCVKDSIDEQCSSDTGLCDCNNNLVWNNGICQLLQV